MMHHISQMLACVFVAVLLVSCPALPVAIGATPENATPTGLAPQSQSDILKQLQYRPQSRPLPDLLFDLENSDARRRWTALRELGDSGEFNTIPKILPRLGDSNLEVRRRTIDTLIRLTRQEATALPYLRKSAETLPETDRLVASAVLEEAAGNASKAAGLYREAFQREPVRYWAAFRGYDLGPLLEKIKVPFLQEVESSIAALDENIKQPKAVYPETVVRQAYALKVFADALGVRVNREAALLIGQGRVTDALHLRQAAGIILEPAYDLGRASKSMEQEIHRIVPNFMLSDYDQSLEKQTKHEQVRIQAAIDLRRYPSSASEEALVRSLRNDPSPLVRSYCAESLGQFCTDSAHEALIKALDLEDRVEVKKNVILALGCRSDSDTRRLVYALTKNHDLWEPSILVVGRWGTNEDTRYLLSLAKEEASSSNNRTITWNDLERNDRISVIAEAMEIASKRSTPQDSGRILQEAARIRRMTESMIPAKIPGQPVPTHSVIGRPGAGQPPVKSPEMPLQAKSQPSPKDEKAVTRVVSEWLAAWNSQDAETQLRFYHPDFIHNGQNLEAYGRAKRAISGRSKNLSIVAKNFKINFSATEAVVQYRQEFKSDQHSDCGIKELTLRKYEGQWRIFREEWRAIKDCPS